MKKRKKNKNLSVQKAGLPPGNLEYRGDIYTQNKTVELITFSETFFQEKKSENAEALLKEIQEDKIYWVNLVGLHNTEAISKIGAHFNIHPLVLEDVLNTDHRPKAEDGNDYLFFTLKMFVKTSENNIEPEQVSIILGKNYVITFQEKEGDVLDIIRERLKDDTSKLRKRKGDYLFYRIIDSLVDSYYQVLEDLGDRIESLEDEIYLNSQTIHYRMAQDLRRELIYLRKTVFPLREAISKASKESINKLIDEETAKHFNDVYDHSIHVIETLETYRDLTSGLMDLYMTTVSNKMNEIMKVLTIIATIFIPITFIAGVYGMNFKNMPELEHEWGYPIALIFMGLIVVAMLIYFKVKKWF
ncbi:MAG: magnesium/cobalt transporter CorA [Flavobacteriales bacterium]|nr:magnesium/cobalt transporter CorA [Flavobacteriales bacterium]